MSNKQTAVEWLYFAMEGFIHKSARVHFAGYFEKAKAMHKEEHGQTWDAAMENMKARGGNDMRAWVDFDEYYNETFEGKL